MTTKASPSSNSFTASDNINSLVSSTNAERVDYSAIEILSPLNRQNKELDGVNLNRVHLYTNFNLRLQL